MKKIKYPKVSVVMNCFNGDKFLHKSISSVINQTYKNWEIIFFDNKSSDNSIKIAKSFKDKRIKIFKTKKFVNLYKARNLAIKKCNGKYISFLDADDLWKKKKLEKQIIFLRKNKNYQIIYSNFSVILQNKNKKFIKYKKGSLPYGFITQKLLNEYSIGILTIMISKKIFRFFRFKSKYNIIGDFDFIIRTSVKFRIGCIQESLAYYRIHKNNYSLNNLKLYISELKYWFKNNEISLKKNNLSVKNQYFQLYKLRIKYILYKFKIWSYL